MKTSEKIDQIAIALSKAQKVMEGAVRDSTNPFFHSKYAELSEVWDACREPLTSNGLSFVQSIHSEEGYSFTNKVQIKDNQGNIKGEKEVLMIWLTVTSRLLHISEQYFEDSISMPVEADPQSIGKVTTYIRRYAQMALCGIAPVDDDGEAAANHQQKADKIPTQPSIKPVAPVPTKPVMITNDQIKILEGLRQTHDLKAKITEFGWTKIEKMNQLTHEQAEQLIKVFEVKDGESK